MKVNVYWQDKEKTILRFDSCSASTHINLALDTEPKDLLCLAEDVQHNFDTIVSLHDPNQEMALLRDVLLYIKQPTIMQQRVFLVNAPRLMEIVVDLALEMEVRRECMARLFFVDSVEDAVETIALWTAAGSNGVRSS